MKHHLHLLLVAGFGAMSIGAAAAVHDWTATRIGVFDTVGVAGMNDAGQVAFGGAVPGSTHAFLYTSGSSGGLVDLGSLGGRITEPRALNASGQVVGFSNAAGGGQLPFVYRNGRIQRLEAPEGQAAVGINDGGQVITQDGTIFHPAGPPTVLKSPSGGPVFPVGINNRGQVAGIWGAGEFPDPRISHGFLYDNGRMINIPGASPRHINESGQIVGTSNGQAFLYSNGEMAEIPGNRAMDINDRGQVVGNNLTGPFSGEAFLYSGGQAHKIADLGGDYSRPEHLNELAQVVGFSSSTDCRPPSCVGGIPAHQDVHAFFYSDDDGRTTDLTRWLMNSFPDVAFVDFMDERTMALNDLGQIAIGATLTNGQHTLIVLTPIPEPSTYALMLAGLGVLAWMARRQRGRSIGN